MKLDRAGREAGGRDYRKTWENFEGEGDRHVHYLDYGVVSYKYTCVKTSNFILLCNFDVCQLYFSEAVKRRKKHMRYNFTLIRLAEFKKFLQCQVLSRIWLYTAKGSINFTRPLWKAIWQFQAEDGQMNIPSTLHFYFQVIMTLERITHVQLKTCISVVSTALFLIPKNWKQMFVSRGTVNISMFIYML